MPGIILGFRGKFAPFSNFHVCRKAFTVNGLTSHISELIYVAEKTLDENVRMAILAMSPGQAKKFFSSKGSNTHLIRGNWDEIKYDIMEQIVWEKFRVNTELAELLKSTGSAIIVEGNQWHDNDWGCCICPNCVERRNEKGILASNALGNILMRIREKLPNG
jgi:ribA/ribD-fused uncharacterized protein